MALAPGKRLGTYEVIAPIGAGGMGEVYRAHDAKLGRDVAVKVLPPELSGDHAALSRFQREAQAVAALSHPHILTIYDFGSADGITYAVAELLNGETLRQRLDRAPLPQKRALEIAGRVALGLAAAHEKGIVHRDLKPENLFLTKDGGVKILDFGIAKLVRPMQPGGPDTVTDHTAAGSLLGTLGYMSPEQVRGEPVDHRSDIFSLGAVLYEMLTQRRAFEGDTAVETLHAILKKEPRPLETLVPALPRGLERIVAHCLEKSPADRFQSARDLAFALGAISDAPADREAASRRSSWRWTALGIALVGAAAAGAAFLSRRPQRAPALPVHAVLPAPEGWSITPFSDLLSLAVSPDGRTVVFGVENGEVSWLYQRPLGAAAPVQINATNGAYGPFFSPDGQWIGFFSHGELKKAPLSGGEPVFLAHVPPINPGGTWGIDGRIVYTKAPNGELWWVSETGGDPQPLTRLDTTRGEQAHLFPQALPGGRGILFTVRHGKDFQEVEKSSIAVLEKSKGTHRIILEGARMARYGGDRLVFLRGSDVFTVPFDVSRLEITGPATAVAEKIVTHSDVGFADFDVSAGGTFTFLEGPPVERPPVSVLQLDRSGNERILPVPSGRYMAPRLSPDGRRLALIQAAGGRVDLAVYERDRGILTALTPEPGRYFDPVWSPDGSRIAFGRFHIGNPTLCTKRADGVGDIQCVTRPSEDAAFATDWSPDGATIAYTALHVSTSERDPTRSAFSSDIWLVGADGKGARPWFETPFSEFAATFSPDGKWIAYVSDESGDYEVFVRPFGGSGGKVKVSNGVGTEPAWSRGGHELIYRTGKNYGQFMSAEVGTIPTLTISQPRVLFTSTMEGGGSADLDRAYDVSADGNEFFGVREPSVPYPERRVVVITDWASTQPR